MTLPLYSHHRTATGSLYLKMKLPELQFSKYVPAHLSFIGTHKSLKLILYCSTPAGTWPS